MGTKKKFIKKNIEIMGTKKKFIKKNIEIMGTKKILTNNMEL